MSSRAGDIGPQPILRLVGVQMARDASWVEGEEAELYGLASMSPDEFEQFMAAVIANEDAPATTREHSRIPGRSMGSRARPTSGEPSAAAP